MLFLVAAAALKKKSNPRGALSDAMHERTRDSTHGMPFVNAAIAGIATQTFTMAGMLLARHYDTCTGWSHHDEQHGR